MQNIKQKFYILKLKHFSPIFCKLFPLDREADEAAAKEHEKLLVIPEKASSFRYHPEKICEDQCLYCGGKFGLFDTPCHIAQIKSAERQKKILECKFQRSEYSDRLLVKKSF